MVLAAIAFALRGLRRGRVTELALAGLAFGLALGTKGSVVYALPALALVVAGASWRLRPAPRLVGVLLGCDVAGAVAFASFAYIQNTVVTGSPSGGLTGLGQRTEALVPNEVHAAWSFVDAPGVSFDWTDRVFAHTLAHVPHWSTPSFAFVVDTSTGEDTMAAGLVGLLVLFPLVLWAGFGRRREPVARALALGSLIYVVFFGATYVADAFAGRVLLVAAALAAPLLAYAARSRWAQGAILVLAVICLFPVLVTNQANPLLGTATQTSVFRESYAQQVTANRPDELALVEALDTHFGPGSRLGFIGGEDSWDFPLFGRDLDRTVRRVDDHTVPTEHNRVRCAWLERYVARTHVNAVVLADGPAPPRTVRALPVGPQRWIIDARDVGRCVPRRSRRRVSSALYEARARSTLDEDEAPKLTVAEQHTPAGSAPALRRAARVQGRSTASVSRARRASHVASVSRSQRAAGPRAPGCSR